MAISVVNGYLCYSGCDAAKARSGQNPHPSTNGAESGQSGSAQQNGGNGVIYGGILGALNATNNIAASGSPGETTVSKSTVDIVA